MTPRSDIAQIVTDQIISALEAGTVPWVRPWSGSGPVVGGMPRNAATGHEYRGINIFLLWLAASARGYSADLWLTQKQVEERGGTIKAGEQPTRIVLSMPMVKVVGKDEETGEARTRRTILLREFWVFNLDQVEGVSVKRLKVKPVAAAVMASNPDGRLPTVDAFVSATGAKVLHGGPSASYSPSADVIRMPSFEAFRAASDYYGTLLHELTHWTGHASRDARFKAVAVRFGDHAYAAEELIAEMGAAILCAELGVEGQLQHAEYIGTWLKVLKGDKHAVFTAASRAQRALDWLTAEESAGEDTAAAAQRAA